MEYTKIAKITDPNKYNYSLETYLKQTETIPHALTQHFRDLYEDNAASLVIWLIKKIQILKKRVEQGDIITTEEGKVLNLSGFKEWILQNFPGIIEDIFPTTKQESLTLTKTKSNVSKQNFLTKLKNWFLG